MSTSKTRIVRSNPARLDPARRAAILMLATTLALPSIASFARAADPIISAPSVSAPSVSAPSVSTPAAPATGTQDKPMLATVNADAALADAADAAPAMSNADRLSMGLDQLKKGQYEESLATLQLVSPEMLGPPDQAKLTDGIAKATDSSMRRKAARAEFEQGEASLAGKQYTDAWTHYRNVVDNRYADEGTRAKAREEMELAKSGVHAAGDSMKATYASAVDDYRANRLPDAKAKFEQLKSSGFRAGLFQKSPGDYLNDINDKMAKMPQPPEAPVIAGAPATQPDNMAMGQPTTPATPAVVPTPATPDNSNAMAGNTMPSNMATTNTEPSAPATMQQPVASTDVPATPATMPSAMNTPPNTPTTPAMPETAPTSTPDQAAMNQSANQPAMTQPAMTQPTMTQPATDQPAMTAPEMAPMPAQHFANASDAYHTAREQYRKGDWVAARQNFTTARDMGYKPGLFEDAPTKYLSRMDVKEQADAAKNRQELAMRQPASDMGGTPTTMGSADADNQPMTNEERIAKAHALVEQAEAAKSGGDVNNALSLYTKAVELDPNNTAAVNGKEEMMTQAGRAPAQDPLASLDKEINARRQEIQYRFSTAIDDANKDDRSKDFNAANQALNKARVARDTDPTIFTPQELQRFDTTIATTADSLARDQSAAQAADLKKQTIDSSNLINQNLSLEQQRQRETVRALIIKARQYVEQAKYTAALGVVDQILVIDPNNDYAVGVRPLIEDRALVAEQRKYREEFDRNFTKVLNEADEKKIPYSDILRYPENWPDLSAEREKSVAQERGEQAADAATAVQLDRVLPEINFPAIPFSDVIDFLRDISQANIFVNWKALEASGIDRNAPVTTRLRNVKFSKALKTILDEVSGGTVKLAYTIDEGVISISTEEDLSKNVVTRVYDIRDLVIDVPDFSNAPDFNLTTSNGSAGGGGGGGGGGGNTSPFGGGGAGNKNNNNNSADLVDQIIMLIEQTVASDSWKTNGGSVGSISPLSGQLIVTQTPENQRLLVKLLEQLRETRAIQVTIETRFLFVQRNFLEDIGVDVDAVFGLNSGGVAGNIPGPISVQQNSANFTQAANLDTTLPGNLGGANFAGSAISTGVTFLDDFSVSVLLRATQAQVNTTQVTAPRITLFNGQRAFVLVSTQRAYVSDLTPIVGSGTNAFDPTISTLSTGVVLDVQATVSSDRKYVTLTLRPSLSRLVDLFTFTVSGISQGIDATTQPIANSGQVQLPEIQITQVNTTVSVPDGGTLLLGGQTLSGEVERVEGVPILSKIPFLKRLFTNRGYAKDDQVLLILVKPTIIIQREREQEQFPLLSQKAGN